MLLLCRKIPTKNTNQKSKAWFPALVLHQKARLRLRRVSSLIWRAVNLTRRDPEKLPQGKQRSFKEKSLKRLRDSRKLRLRSSPNTWFGVSSWVLGVDLQFRDLRPYWGLPLSAKSLK